MHIKSEWHDGGCSLKQKGKKLQSYVSVSCICQCELSHTETRGGEKKKSDRIIHGEDSSHRRDRLSTSRPLVFAVKSETQCCTSRFWYIQYYICHRYTSHELKNKYRHAQPLCTTHYMWCPEGCSLQCNSLMRQEVCTQSTAPSPPLVCSWLRSHFIAS